MKQNLKTSARNLGCKLVFLMDNDPKHIAILVRNGLKDNKVNVLERPSQSPDVGLIENLKAELKACVGKVTYKPDSVTLELV